MTQTEKTKDNVILIRETTAESIKSDLFSFATACALIGVGVYLESDAMQWTGAALFWMVIMAQASGQKKKTTKTPQQAADWLRDKFNVRAS